MKKLDIHHQVESLKKQNHNAKGQYKLINSISNNRKNGIKGEEGVKAEVEQDILILMVNIRI